MTPYESVPMAHIAMIWVPKFETKRVHNTSLPVYTPLIHSHGSGVNAHLM
jgi:hypothetical protein